MENHKLTIENRQTTTVTDIVEIDSFDESEVRATLNEGAMIIKGERLNIHSLDLDEGTAVISGRIDSLMYVKVKEKNDKNIIVRLLK